MPAVFYHRYQLQSASSLNAASQKTVHGGALIKSGDGYGCIHPWPELGDDSLDEQLAALAAGQSTPLVDSALRCAAADGSARREGRSLFVDPIPESHWLAMPGDDPPHVKAEGFNTVKLKVGRNLLDDAGVIEAWADAGFRLRMDLNESLSLATFVEFWESLGRVQKRVQLVEDPVIWNPDSWRVLREIGVPVAVDRDAENRFHDGETAVIKPAVSNWLPPGEAPFMVTSYMDHAIGQCWAAVEAARLKREQGRRFLGCGLLTHRCFASDPFFERLSTEGPVLLPPHGSGLGFDDLLEALPWESLT